MLDFKKIFKNFVFFKKNLERRGVKESDLLEIKEKIKKKNVLVKKINELRNLRNIISRENINENNTKEKKNNSKNLKEKIKKCTEELNIIEKKLFKMMSEVPNILHEDVPHDENEVIKVIEYDCDLKNSLIYEDIIEKKSLINKDLGVTLSGSKFVVYKDFGSILLHSLINLLLRSNYKDGYSIIDAPYLIKKSNLFNTGQLPKFEKELFLLENDLCLIPTSEVSLVNLFKNSTISVEELPIKVTSYSPCFRVEAGAAGKENKGLIRLHQFNKVEIVQIVVPGTSDLCLDDMIKTSCKVLNLLNITHRIVNICDKELGFSAHKTLDIEVWMPVSKKWLEISSCSNCDTFQSRRANIKFVNQGEKFFVHTFNSSSLAIDRLIAVICEYYYDEKKEDFFFPEILEKEISNFIGK